MGDSRRHFSVIVRAAEEQAVLFLSLNIRFLKLTVSSKEPELKYAGSQELMRGQPQSRGCQRPRRAALASRCICWRHEGWSEEQKRALSPKLRGCPGAQATARRAGEAARVKTVWPQFSCPYSSSCRMPEIGQVFPRNSQFAAEGLKIQRGGSLAWSKASLAAVPPKNKPRGAAQYVLQQISVISAGFSA